MTLQFFAYFPFTVLVYPLKHFIIVSRIFYLVRKSVNWTETILFTNRHNKLPARHENWRTKSVSHIFLFVKFSHLILTRTRTKEDSPDLLYLNSKIISLIHKHSVRIESVNIFIISSSTNEKDDYMYIVVWLLAIVFEINILIANKSHYWLTRQTTD